MARNKGATNDEHTRHLPPGNEPLLDLSGVSKRYGAEQALDQVALIVQRGEVLALCGENGSGKSTLAKIISGAVTRDAGDYRVNGRRVDFTGPKDAIDMGIVLVAQEPTAAPAMSIAENVLLASGTFKRPWSRVRRRELADTAQPHLDAVGLGHLDPLLPFATLGQGQRELVEVAKALAAEPRLLILDEVTTRLPDTDGLFGLVERLAADGVSTILITHRLREVRSLAHRAVVLRDGRLAGSLAKAEMTDRRLSAMMVGRELDEHFVRPETVPGGTLLDVEGLVTDRCTTPLDLRVRQGEIVGLAGLVGSGRSELLETVALARRPRGGVVRVKGDDVTGRRPRDGLRAGVSLLPEDRHAQGLILSASIIHNIGLAALTVFSRTDRRRERRDAEQARSRLRIRCSDVGASVATLSGGNQQKVVFARVLANAPQVLLLDEPTRGVDIGAREEIYRIIVEQAERGVGVVVASSDMVELLGICDRILVMHEGAIAGELSRAEATEEAIMLLAATGLTHPRDADPAASNQVINLG
jgi:ABC-type sugar transport system ATPase subunit